MKQTNFRNGDNLTVKAYFELVFLNTHFQYSSRWKWWKQTTLYWCIPLSVAGIVISAAIIWGGIYKGDPIEWGLAGSLFFLPFICILPLVWLVSCYNCEVPPTIHKTEITCPKDEKDLSAKVTKWLRQNDRPTPADIVAVNIGLFETGAGYALYLIGSRHYDANNDDWACEEDFTPKTKYLYISTKEAKNRNWKDFQECIARIVTGYKEKKTEDPSSLFYHKIVTLGFDDGDLVRIQTDGGAKRDMPTANH